MYDFTKHLEPDEKILYQCKAVPKSSITSSFIFLLLMIVMILLEIITYFIFIEYHKNIVILIMFIILLFFNILFATGFIYNLFINRSKAKNCFYCLTNKRVFRYNLKKNKLIYGYLIDYADIRIHNVSHNCGDIYMGVILSSTSDVKTDLVNLATVLSDSKNKPYICFSCIENPEYVLSLIRSARADLLYDSKNNG